MRECSKHSDKTSSINAAVRHSNVPAGQRYLIIDITCDHCTELATDLMRGTKKLAPGVEILYTDGKDANSKYADTAEFPHCWVMCRDTGDMVEVSPRDIGM